MQVTETQSEGLKREFKVQIEAKEIDDKMTWRLEELGQTVKIPGFRPGKVPLKILKQRFGRSVLGEVLERAVSDGSNQAISERGLRPAMQPKIEITSFDEGKDLEFTMALELLPDIEPMDFSIIELERDVIEIEDGAVQETLEDIAKAHKKTKPLDTPRAAQSGDVLVMDFAGTVDGEAYPGMSAEDHHLELGSNAFVADFEDQLTGAEIGETREVKVTFPNEYANDRLAGKDAVFTVTIKNILESVPATIDDEFATAMGEANLEALKERIRERIASEYREFARTRLKRQLLDRLADGHDFAIPEGMRESEFDVIWKQIEQDREAGQLDPDDEAKDEEELKADYRAIAERRVRLGLLISEVGRRNGIEVTEEEANRALLREAQRYPGKEREVFEFYQKTPEAMANLRAPIFEDKVVDFIVDLAQVAERTVTPEQLREEIETESTDTEDSRQKPAKKSARSETAAKSAEDVDAEKKSETEQEASETSA